VFGMVDWWMLDVKVLVGWCRKMNVGENDRGVVGRGGEGSGSLLRISAEGGLWLINASQRGKKKGEEEEERRRTLQNPGVVCCNGNGNGHLSSYTDVVVVSISNKEEYVYGDGDARFLSLPISMSTHGDK